MVETLKNTAFKKLYISVISDKTGPLNLNNMDPAEKESVQKGHKLKHNDDLTINDQAFKQVAFDQD